MNSDSSSKKWLAYFDILGFCHLITKSGHSPDFILSVYYEALREAENVVQFSSEVKRIHFSDTFIFYSKDDSAEWFAWIQSVAKNFMRRCLQSYIPLRGAITCGEFYADEEKAIYWGDGLCEAHAEAESQEWIGLILTKTAEQIVDGYDLQPQNFQFPIVYVPMKPKASFENRRAYDFHKNVQKEETIQALNAMMRLSPSEAKHKYQNTLDFINKP